MDLGNLLITLLVVLAVLTAIGLAVIGYVMWRYRVPPRGVLAMFGALAYLASPVDVVPELVLGPVGLVDDAGVVTGVGFFVYRLVVARRMLRKGGVLPGSRPPR